MKIKLVKRLNEQALFLYFGIDVPKFDGITLWRFVFAEEEDINSESLVMHEMTHVKQWDRDGWKFIYNYIFKPEKRFEYEAEAYAKQALVETDKLVQSLRINDYSKILAKNYMLNISVDEAKKAIMNWIR